MLGHMQKSYEFISTKSASTQRTIEHTSWFMIIKAPFMYLYIYTQIHTHIYAYTYTYIKRFMWHHKNEDGIDRKGV